MFFLSRYLPHSDSQQRFSGRAGLTLIELLIVLTILAILATIVAFSVQRYISRSNDSIRKTHMEKYRIALEEYHTDKGRYPESSALLVCGSNALAPYVHAIYCDPQTGQPYLYQTNLQGTEYILLTHLDEDADPIISERGCENGCGPDNDGDGMGDFNYGLTSQQAATGESIERLEYSPTCGSPQSPSCIPGSCGTCCPGALRCNGTGTGCFVDLSCSN